MARNCPQTTWPDVPASSSARRGKRAGWLVALPVVFAALFMPGTGLTHKIGLSVAEILVDEGQDVTVSLAVKGRDMARAIGRDLVEPPDLVAPVALEAAAAAGEKLWSLPLYDEYLQLLQKGPADLRNIGGRWGGAITAALFLGEFVPRELPWAHLDIAGPAFAEDDLPDAPAGGTGAAVLTLLRWLEKA